MAKKIDQDNFQFPTHPPPPSPLKKCTEKCLLVSRGGLSGVSSVRRPGSEDWVFRSIYHSEQGQYVFYNDLKRGTSGKRKKEYLRPYVAKKLTMSDVL
jgi:hypothetical protein